MNEGNIAGGAAMGYANKLPPPLNPEVASCQTGSAARGLRGIGDACAARQSAKDVIRDRAVRLRREAEQLEALARALPEELPRPADEALWELAIARR